MSESGDDVGLTVRELVAELAMGPIEDYDEPALAVMERRGFLGDASLKVKRAEELMKAWESADGEPATSHDLTVLTITNRHGRELRVALTALETP